MVHATKHLERIPSDESRGRIHMSVLMWFRMLAGYRPALMGKPLSMELRSRALAAVDGD